MTLLVIWAFILIGINSALHVPPPPPGAVKPWDDVNFPKAGKTTVGHRVRRQAQFKYKWLGIGGTIHDEEAEDRLEIAATMTISETAHQVGANIIGLMLRNAPREVFERMLDNDARVGLFTTAEGTTIFPEYAHLRDRPECAGTCAGACSNTCTGDGRKYDSLAGLGGIRATCVDDNFMCTARDPYRRTSNILVHEFAHTLHQYGLPQAIWNQIYAAWLVAPWERGSYAMSNHNEYYAEASGTYFNVNHHATSSGGMNSCGRTSGFCQSEEEARDWLELMDPDLEDALSYSYNERTNVAGNLRICMYPFRDE